MGERERGEKGKGERRGRKGGEGRKGGGRMEKRGREKAEKQPLHIIKQWLNIFAPSFHTSMKGEKKNYFLT